MTPSIIIVAILGFFTALTLLASAILFLYVVREFRRIFIWLTDFTKMYLGLDFEPDKIDKSPSGGHVVMEKPWDDNKDGQS